LLNFFKAVQTASDLVHFFKNSPKSWFKPISSRYSSFKSEENFFYTKNHYFRRVMALRKIDNLAISVDENIEDEVDLDVELDDHTKNHRHGIRR